MKGNSRIFGFNSLSQELHYLESRIDEIRKDKSTNGGSTEELEEILEGLKLSLYNYVSLSKEIFGEESLGENTGKGRQCRSF